MLFDLMPAARAPVPLFQMENAVAQRPLSGILVFMALQR
jgi:hypothetical protein